MSRQSPSFESPSTGSPSTESPSTGSPSTGSPSTGSPSTGSPSTGSPSIEPRPRTPEGTFGAVEEHFHAALELSPDQRANYLEQVPASLRRRLAELLDAAAADDTLPRPRWAAELARTNPDSPAAGQLEAGHRIGRYRILESLGEGGFGAVYRAEQTEPIRREVALKVVKWGMDSRDVVARFDAERQALALMDHPSIARVLDGGATDSGRPFFVMELVRGSSLTGHARHHRLELGRRLQLFVQVCEAVQHAHQKGVVHRDLKPSNVLVTEVDGVAVPKVIDFGIAKAMSGRLTDRTLDSARYRLLGTPAYMSPEQARGDLDVDTRTDVYALGVLLYELLCDSPPFDPDRLARAGLSEMVRILTDEEPPRPSQRISSSRPEDSALAHRLRGDLDWIVGRALDKDRGRRYATASELAADVQRHLRREPVAAGPPSRLYRWRKFVSRNRLPVGLAGLILVALVAGMIGTGAGLVEASRQRDAARNEAHRARAATDFLVETLALADPEISLDPELSVRSLLDRAAARVESALQDQPAAEARVRSALGRAYESLAEHAVAEGHLRRAIELDEQVDALEDRELYDALWTLTHVLYRLERPDAQEIAQRARMEAHRLVRRRSPAMADLMDEAIGQIRSGVHLPDSDPIQKAILAVQRIREMASQELPPDDPLWPLIADGCMDAGFSLWYTPHEARSTVFFRCAAEVRRQVLPSSHPDVSEAIGMWAGVLNRMGRPEEAEPLIRGALEDIRRVFPSDNFQAAFTEAMLGENLSAQGRFAEAEPHLLRSHRVIMQLSDDPATFFPIDSHGRMIRLYEGWGRLDVATPYRRSLAEIGTRATWPIPWVLVRGVMAPGDQALVGVLDRIAGACGAIAYSALPGELDSAELMPLLGELAPKLSALPTDDPRAVVVARLMVYWTNALRPGEQARPVMAQMALEVLGGLQDRLPLDLAEALAVAATGAVEPERSSLADRAWRLAGAQAADSAADGLGADSWFTANAKTRIARAFLELGQEGRARGLLESATATLEVQLGRGNRNYREASRILASLRKGLTKK